MPRRASGRPGNPSQAAAQAVTAGLAGRRIALFCGNYNYTRDGANLVLNRWVAHLEAACGCEVRVYSPTDGTPDFAPAGALVTIPSVPIPGRAEYRLALGLPAAARADLKAFAPHLVHLATPDLLGWKALAAARRLGAPVVGSFHTRFDTYLPYYGLGALAPVVNLAVRAFYRRCDYVLAPSRAMIAELAEARATRLRPWGRGVDRARFDPARRDHGWRAAHGFSPEDVVVLSCGRLVREKGLAVFVQAMARACARAPAVRPLVIGEGPARAWLARRLPGAVFTGQLAGRELATAMASADVLLNPSITEAFSNVTLEAMASGLAVVAAAVPVQRDLVTPEAGILCRPGDAESFACAIMRLARHVALIRELGAEGRRQSAHHLWSDVLARGVAVYLEALALPAPSKPAPRL